VNLVFRYCNVRDGSCPCNPRIKLEDGPATHAMGKALGALCESSHSLTAL
jgi:hypothetical protein